MEGRVARCLRLNFTSMGMMMGKKMGGENGGGDDWAGWVEVVFAAFLWRRILNISPHFFPLHEFPFSPRFSRFFRCFDTLHRVPIIQNLQGCVPLLFSLKILNEIECYAQPSLRQPFYLFYSSLTIIHCLNHP